MKKYIVLSFATMLFIGSGCKRDIIDLAPITATSKTNFYKTSSDFLQAVNAIYGILQSAGISNEYVFGDLPSDDAFANSSRIIVGEVDYDNFTVLPSGAISSNLLRDRWNNCYIAISYANTLLDKIDAADFEATLKSQYAGQAKFLRAYFYFTLVKTFGDVPLSVHEVASVDEAYKIPRSPAKDIYAQIQKDLQDAINMLPATFTGADAGRVTSIAARGLLARVLLFQRKFSEALPILKPAIEEPGSYGLLSDYASVFKYNNGNNSEILFAIQYSGTSTVSAQNNAVTNVFYASNVNQPTSDIVNAFGAGDKRKDASIIGIGNTSDSRVFKYMDPTQGLIGGTDYPILRYADILLMYAECLNETGDVNGALPYINRVRARAYGNSSANYQATDPGSTTYVFGQADLRTKILLERRLEFCFEGQRFWDLVRTDHLDILNNYFAANKIKVNGAVIEVKPYQKLYPLPQTIVDTNPAQYTQNPGY